MSNFVPGIGSYFTITCIRKINAHVKDDFNRSQVNTISRVKSDDRSFYNLTLECVFSDNNFVIGKVVHNESNGSYEKQIGDLIRFRTDEYSFQISHPDMLKLLGVDMKPEEVNFDIELADDKFKNFWGKFIKSISKKLK